MAVSAKLVVPWTGLTPGRERSLGLSRDALLAHQRRLGQALSIPQSLAIPEFSQLAYPGPLL